MNLAQDSARGACVAFALAVSACSSSSGGGNGTPAAGSAANAASSGNSSGPTSNGPTRGCGQGTSCTPGDDLAAPSPDQGFQIQTPDNAIVMQPGQEQFLCFFKNIPTTTAVDIGTMQSWMTPGSSHHFIAYQVGAGGAGSFGGLLGGPQPDGTLNQCATGNGTWIYATSVAGQIIEMKMPDGVGLPFPVGTQISLNMHFANVGSSVAYPKVKMNFLYAQNVQYKAAAMVSFNTQINIPPATANGPGTQTVQGTCTAPAGSKFFAMTTHTHKRGVLSEVNYVSGGQTMNIVHTTDWEHPDVALWNPPDFLTVQQGDSFTYSCAYENQSSSVVTVGQTAATNEMCMAIGYYFPAASTSCR